MILNHSEAPGGILCVWTRVVTIVCRLLGCNETAYLGSGPSSGCIFMALSSYHHTCFKGGGHIEL